MHFATLSRSATICGEFESFGTMIDHSLVVSTRDLTKAVRRLRRAAKLSSPAPLVYLSFAAAHLKISFGQSSEVFPATGVWRCLVSVDARWLKSLAESPHPEINVDLQVHSGKLWSQRHGVECTLHEDEEPAPRVIKNRKARHAAL